MMTHPKVEGISCEGVSAGSTLICGIDVGGSGCRVRVIDPEQRSGHDHANMDSDHAVCDHAVHGRVVTDLTLSMGVSSGPKSGVGTSGVLDVDSILAAVRQRLRDDCGVTGVTAVCLGCAGIASLASDRSHLCLALARMFHASCAVLAPDSLTAHAGALSGRAGVVVAAGTGVIALATDYHAVWRRVDGWGYLLGDSGSGAWIGSRALHIALNAYEHRGDERSDALLAAAVRQFGEPRTWPMAIYPHPDRAKIVASFVPAVVACSLDDPVARRLLERAGREIASTACAAVSPDVGHMMSYAGGIMTHCAVVRESFIDDVRRLQPDIRVLDPEGTPLDGSVVLAAQCLADPDLTLGPECEIRRR